MNNSNKERQHRKGSGPKKDSKMAAPNKDKKPDAFKVFSSAKPKSNSHSKARPFKEGKASREEKSFKDGNGYRGEKSLRDDRPNKDSRTFSKNRPNREGRPQREPKDVQIRFNAKDPRVTPPCPYYKTCGGCQLQEYSYADSLRYKTAQVEKLLGGMGKIDPIIGMENPWHYRNKSHFTYSFDKKGKMISGMYEAYSHKLVAIDNCLINDQRADAIAKTVKDLMQSFKLPAYDEDRGTGFLRHVLVKVGFETNEVIVVLVTVSPVFPSKANFVKALRAAHPEITTIIQNVNNLDTSVVLGRIENIMYGKGYIEDYLMGQLFQISAKSFYQINPVQTEKLYSKAIEMARLTGQEVVLDAYSGIGTIGITASGLAKEVIGVELNKDAVKDAIINAKRNQVRNARFYADDAGRFMVDMAEDGKSLDVVFMDPPRSGSDEAFLGAVLTAKPQRLVYVSCNPVTLARDLITLTQGGYKIKTIQPVDLFPWTSHVEAIILMTRSGSGTKK